MLDVSDYLAIEQSYFWKPISIFQNFEFSSYEHIYNDKIPSLLLLSLFFCIIGFGYRIFAPLAFICAFFIIGFPLNFGKVHHSGHLLVAFPGLLMFVKYPGRLSIDAIISKYFLKKEHPLESPEYGWPFKLCLIYLCLIYFASGYQKLEHSGLEWIFSDNLATIILTRPTVTPLGIWVSNHKYLCNFLAFYTVFIELFCPLALLNKHLTFFFIGSCFLLHVGSQLLLGAHGDFTNYLFCYTFLVPWTKFLRLNKVNLNY